MKEFKIGDRVSVKGEQVFSKIDQCGTIINIFLSTVKVQLDNGSKWFVSNYHCEPHTDQL